MRAWITLWLVGALLALAACSAPQTAAEPDEAQIKHYVETQFAQAYGRWLALKAVHLKPVKSELTTEDHRVYEVTLDAVVTENLDEALKRLPEKSENLEARGRIKGIMSMGGVEKGHRITARLRALVERNPRTGAWSVVGLIRNKET